MTIKRHNAWKATITNTRTQRPSAPVEKSESEPAWVKCKAERSTEDPDCGPTAPKQQKVTDESASPGTRTDADPEEFSELVQYMEHEEIVTIPGTNKPITFKNCSNVTINFLRP